MKYAHYNNETREIIGWYDSDIHETIPTPNESVTDTEWQDALDNNHNHISPTNIMSNKDFRPPGERETSRKQAVVREHERYLASTDWYVTRFIETGEVIPDDVSSLRAEARLRIGDNR